MTMRNVKFTMGEVPQPNTRKSWYSEWAKGTEANLLAQGTSVSRPYEQSSWIHVAIKKVAQNLASVPFIIYKGNEPIKNHPLVDLFNHPNQLDTKYTLWERTATYMNLKGESFWIIGKSVGQIAGTSTVPAVITVCNPDYMKHVINKDTGKLIGWTFNGKIPLEVEEVIQFAFVNPYDPYRGLSPIKSIVYSMEADYQSSKWNKQFFENSAMPLGTLETENFLQDDEYKRLKARWNQQYRGVNKAHQVAVLEGGLKFNAIQNSHKDMDFVSGRVFSRDEILSVFGVPKTMLGLTEGLNRATAYTHKRMFWTETVLPMMKNIEYKVNEELIKKVDPSLRGFFDTDQIEELREDLKTKAQIAESFQRLGVPLEATNNRLNLDIPDVDKIEGSDVAYIPVNLVPAGEMPEEQEPVKEVEEVIEKDTSNTISKVISKRRFLSAQRKIESKFYSKLKRFFFEQRKNILANLPNQKAPLTYNNWLESIGVIWEAEGDKLEKMMSPLYTEAVETGGNLALATLGYETVFDVGSPEAAALITSRANRIRGVNTTVWRALQNQIKDGIEKGESIDKITDRIKGTYNTITSKARAIARTESVSALNESSLNEYKSNGIQQKEWVTAGDGNVRASHYNAEDDGAIPVSQNFSNGLKFPGDPGASAEETVNCRCTLVPVVQE